MVVLVAAGVVVAVRSGDGGSAGSTPAEAAGAHRALLGLIEAASFDNGRAVLGSCPLGSLTDLDRAVGGAITLDKAVARAAEVDALIDQTDTYPAHVSCAQNVDDVTAVDGVDGITYEAMLTPPKDYLAAAQFDGSINGAGSGEGIDVHSSKQTTFDGGTVFEYCGTRRGSAGCGAAWIDTGDRLGVDLFLDGLPVELEGTVTEAQALAALKSVLGPIISGLSAADASAATAGSGASTAASTAEGGSTPGDGTTADTGGIDAQAAHDGLTKLIAGTSFGGSQRATLANCPLGSFASLDAAVGSSITLPATLASGLTQIQVLRTNTLSPFEVSCVQAGTDTDTSAGIVAISFEASPDPAQDYQAAAIKAYDGFLVPVFAQSTPYRGGTIHSFCAKPDSGAGAPSCAAAWIDDHRLLGIETYANGTLSGTDLVAALKSLLGTVPAALAGAG
ncbi:MAG: hypothetical protein JWM34_1759 [Ilumatobacteraceae bacterium]|nr:hypothetical protein [Ilumatobacteraceae bacterium]